MKEHPILFSTPMVRAILGGRKTQTRRVLNPQPSRHHWEKLPGHVLHKSMLETSKGLCAKFYHSIPGNTDEWEWVRSPFGSAGDLLWVRETWSPWLNDEGAENFTRLIKFKADDHTIPVPFEKIDWFEERSAYGWHDRPSIHMPKWVCRIWLKVTGVRVEPLQDISHDDAIAEGVDTKFSSEKNLPVPTDQFKDLWESINADRGYSWASNPWVWVVEFERVEHAK